MATLRKTASLLVGGVQCVLGGVASIFAYLILTNQQIQDMLSILPREAPLFMFLLIVFGTLSILSGLLLVREGNGGF